MWHVIAIVPIIFRTNNTTRTAGARPERPIDVTIRVFVAFAGICHKHEVRWFCICKPHFDDVIARHVNIIWHKNRKTMRNPSAKLGRCNHPIIRAWSVTTFVFQVWVCLQSFRTNGLTRYARVKKDQCKNIASASFVKIFDRLRWQCRGTTYQHHHQRKARHLQFVLHCFLTSSIYAGALRLIQ